ncbi:hypothetical protein [Phenylobacterium sp. SCN 70-31]|uniref:hypothetical protein n=1 Tax=Phenylobacterium sp. SCN 70-31 TaxID=1660129 RepID=UPI0025CFD10D|nr:hypothetical protein [Phenylobacterium sp. SCN 70-31]
MSEKFINFDFRSDEMTEADWQKVEETAFAVLPEVETPMLGTYCMVRRKHLDRIPSPIRRVVVKESDATWFKTCWSHKTNGHSNPLSAVEIESDPYRLE